MTKHTEVGRLLPSYQLLGRLPRTDMHKYHSDQQVAVNLFIRTLDEKMGPNDFSKISHFT